MAGFEVIIEVRTTYCPRSTTFRICQRTTGERFGRFETQTKGPRTEQRGDKSGDGDRFEKFVAEISGPSMIGNGQGETEISLDPAEWFPRARRLF
jgi:hypothetical protein